MAVALLACAETHAALVKWTLNNVSFDDGGTASGFFIVDTTTGRLAVQVNDLGSLDEVFDIKTTDGTKPTPLVPLDYCPYCGGSYSILVNGTEYYPAAAYGDYTVPPALRDHSFEASNNTYHFDLSITLWTDADLLHTTHGTFSVLASSEETATDWDPHSFFAANQILMVPSLVGLGLEKFFRVAR